MFQTLKILKYTEFSAIIFLIIMFIIIKINVLIFNFNKWKLIILVNLKFIKCIFIS